jgi:hypothetical protein
MSRTHLWISAAIIALVVFVAFALSVPHTHDVAIKKAADAVASVPVVSLHDVYKKGTHTISGAVTVPNACIPVEATASLVGSASSTQNILVALTFPNDSGTCLQLPTSVTFETTLAAPAKLPIEASVNGVTASTSST